MLGHIEGTNNVDFKNFEHLLWGEDAFWGDKHTHRNYSSAVNHSTNFAKLFYSELKELDDIFLIADIGLEKLTSRELLSKRSAKFFIQVSNNDLNTKRGKEPDGGFSKSRGTSSDNGD